MLKKQKGFTFIEIMMVLGIILLITVLTTPNLKGMKSELSAYSNIKFFKYDILNTQRLAYEESSVYIINFEKEGYSIVNSNGKYKRNLTPYGDNLIYTNNSLSDNEMIFLKDGFPTKSGTVILTNKKDNNQISIEFVQTTGRVNVK